MAKAFSPKTLALRGAVLVGENQTHQILEFPDKAKNGWRSFYVRLVDPPKGRSTKRAWWLGHDGVRLARSTDAAKLTENDPATTSWVCQTLRKLIDQ